MSDVEEFIRDFERWCARRGKAVSSVSGLALKDSRAVNLMINKMQRLDRQIARLKEFMAEFDEAQARRVAEQRVPSRDENL